MTTSRYRRLNILITMLMVIAFFIETLVSRLYVWVNIFLVCRIHSHHPIFSLKGEFWAHKTNLILPPLFIGFWFSFSKNVYYLVRADGYYRNTSSGRLLQKHVERTVITETRREDGYYRKTSSGRLLQKHVGVSVITARSTCFCNNRPLDVFL
jgi:hypothetical protein